VRSAGKRLASHVPHDFCVRAYRIVSPPHTRHFFGLASGSLRSELSGGRAVWSRAGGSTTIRARTRVHAHAAVEEPAASLGLRR